MKKGFFVLSILLVLFVCTTAFAGATAPKEASVQPGYIVKDYADEQEDAVSLDGLLNNPAGFFADLYAQNPLYIVLLVVIVAAAVIIILLLAIYRNRKKYEAAKIETDAGAGPRMRRKHGSGGPSPPPSTAPSSTTLQLGFQSDKKDAPVFSNQALADFSQPSTALNNEAPANNSNKKIEMNELQFSSLSDKLKKNHIAQKPKQEDLQKLGVDDLPLFTADPIISASRSKVDPEPPKQAQVDSHKTETFSQYTKQPSDDVDDVLQHVKKNK